MIDKFLEYITIERKYSALTASAYKRDLYELCSFLDTTPEDFSPKQTTEDDIKSFLIAQLDKGASARSVKRKLSAFRSFWKFLLGIGYTDVDITARIISPKTDRPLPVFYKESEMERATAQEDSDDDFSSVRNSLIIELLYQTGMRRAELLALKDKDIDSYMKQIRVLGKRNKERMIPVSDDLLGMIQRYQEYRDALPEIHDTQLLLLSDKGKPLSKTALYGIVHNRMSEVSTLKKQSPHVLRHTFATTMLDNGADINTIKTIMGHASLAATQIYTHTTFEQIKAEYKRAHPRAKRK